MKKYLLIASFLLSFAGIGLAQTAPAKPAKKEKAAKAATTTTPATATPAAKPATAPAGPTKKDGTADMRYKSNKEAAKAATPAGAVTVTLRQR